MSLGFTLRLPVASPPTFYQLTGEGCDRDRWGFASFQRLVALVQTLLRPLTDGYGSG